METLTTNLLDLAMLVLLQAVLGFDNLLYISLESKDAPIDKQPFVRMMGIGIAIVFRIGLLFLLIALKDIFKNPVLFVNWKGIFTGEFSIHSLIVFAGGGFIIYTAIKEVWHMIALEEYTKLEKKDKTSVKKAIVMIVIMNIVFSFDSILSAMALSDVLWVMTTAVIIGGILMIWLSGTVASFLQKNRIYEVLGLFVLLLVGIMLLTEGGHIAKLHILGGKITAMNKTTFYFVIVFLVLVDIVQGRYQKRLMKMKKS